MKPPLNYKTVTHPHAHTYKYPPIKQNRFQVLLLSSIYIFSVSSYVPRVDFLMGGKVSNLKFDILNVNNKICQTGIECWKNVFSLFSNTTGFIASSFFFWPYFYNIRFYTNCDFLFLQRKKEIHLASLL